MKRVQLAGGDTAIEQVLVGLERELRVDLQNDSLRLHDGAKVGGYEFLNRDQSDGRYQRRSLELDGFKFGAQEKGILVRVSPSNYKLRKITVNENNFSITNPRGTGGDFYFTLLPTVASDHTWSGDHTFIQPITATGGVVGNLTGDVVGDLLGDVTGNVTGNLTGNAAGDHTGSFTGDVDVRGFTIQFDDGQIPEEAIDPAAFVNRGVPYGAIIMWAGLVVEIPDSWALCDGDNGTPDLRNRFIVGAGDDYAEGAVGGSLTSPITGTIEPGGEHSHDLTIAGHALTIAETPAHKHGNGVGNNKATLFNHGTLPADPPSAKEPDLKDNDGDVEGYTTTVGGGATHTHAGSTAVIGGTHDHVVTLDNVTAVPPYYALCFIMKIV